MRQEDRVNQSKAGHVVRVYPVLHGRTEVS